MLPDISFSNLKLVQLGESVLGQNQISFIEEDTHKNWFVAMAIEGKYYVDTQCNLRFATVIEPHQVEKEQAVPDLNRRLYLPVQLVPGLPQASSFATLASLLMPLIDHARPLIADPALDKLMYVTIREITGHLGQSLRWTLLYPPEREESLYVNHDVIAMMVGDKVNYVRRLLQQQGLLPDEEE